MGAIFAFWYSSSKSMVHKQKQPPTTCVRLQVTLTLKALIHQTDIQELGETNKTTTRQQDLFCACVKGNTSLPIYKLF